MTTPGPWRKKRESLDAAHPELGPTRWEIVAGTEKKHRNMGAFHPDDAAYTTDEHTVVGFGYDRDYGNAEGGIENEADADLIVKAVAMVDWLASLDDSAERHSVTLQQIIERAKDARQ